MFPIRNKQRLDFNRVLLAWFFAIAAITLVCGAAAGTHPGTEQAVPAANPAKIKVDYPLNGSVFPPDITAPTFLWHDPSQTGTGWVIGISFAGHKQIRIVAPGKNMQVGELDPDAGPGLELTPEQAAQLKARVDAGESQAAVARDVGITRETLYQYLRAA